jgi:ABC-2 type transport system ATP-binding protein
MPPALELDQVTIRYRLRPAVRELSLTVRAGEVYALLGPNGAGKTTTLKTVVNLRAPSAGVVRVLGVDSRRLGPGELARIGYVSENQHLPATVSIGRLEAFCRSWYPTWDRALADELRARFELDRRTYLPMLSRGTRLKVACLLALAPRPRLLVLDEPFSGLDPVVRDDVTAALLDVVKREGSSAIVASHEMDDLERLVDRVGFLHEGRLLVDEPLHGLLDRFRRAEQRPMSLRDVFVSIARAHKKAPASGAPR